MATSYHELPHNLTFHRLDGSVNEKFDCGDDEQNEFLQKLAWVHQQGNYSVTYVAHVGGMLAGYVTLVVSEIELEKGERPPDAPFARLGALKLAQMGVDKRFQGHHLGRTLVDFAIVKARTLAKSDAGCAYVILDAKPTVVDFYTKIGFVPNELEQKKRKNRAKNLNRPLALSMRFDVREPEGEAGSKAAAAPNWVGGLGGAIGFFLEHLPKPKKNQ